MATPKGGYYLADGTKGLGTTTVIGRFKDSAALVGWAYKQGKEHQSLLDRGLPAPKSLYDVTQKAADIGTAGHELVEAHIKGELTPEKQSEILFPLPDEDKPKAISAYNSYCLWESMFKVEVLEQEIPMVSQTYGFGGTPDAVGYVNGKLSMLDWKTSNGVYSDYIIQLGAYENLWNEVHPDNPITGGSHLLRFSKDHGDFHHHHFGDTSDGWEMFKLLLQAYRLDAKLKKRI